MVILWLKIKFFNCNCSYCWHEHCSLKRAAKTHDRYNAKQSRLLAKKILYEKKSSSTSNKIYLHYQPKLLDSIPNEMQIFSFDFFAGEYLQVANFCNERRENHPKCHSLRHTTVPWLPFRFS